MRGLRGGEDGETWEEWKMKRKREISENQRVGGRGGGKTNRMIKGDKTRQRKMKRSLRGYGRKKKEREKEEERKDTRRQKKCI